MNGLKQIQVVTQGDGWHLIGLDDQGRVWFGTTRRTARGRGIAWTLMEEGADAAPPPTSAPQPPEAGPGRWPSRPRA